MGRRLVAGTAVAIAVVAGVGAATSSAQAQIVPPVPYGVHHGDDGTTVWVNNVGVHITPHGAVCPLVSTQDWICIGGGS